MTLAQLNTADLQIVKEKGLEEKLNSANYILNLVSRLNSSLDIRDVMKDLLTGAIEITDTTRGILILKDELGRDQEILALDRDNSELKKEDFSDSFGLIYDVYTLNESKFLQYGNSDKKWLAKNLIQLNIKNIISVPINFNDEKLGVIYLDSSRTQKVELNKITDNFELYINNAAIALKNSMKFKEQLDNNGNLEKKIMSLQEKTSEVDKVEKLKYDFLAQMSHEIRTPIHKILGFTSILKDHFRQSFDTDLIKNCEIIDKGGKRLVRTIDLMINMSEIRSGAVKFVKEKFSFANEIRPNLETEFKKMANDKGLYFYISDNTSHDIINADIESVNQIMRNIVHNAVKYTIDGGVDVIMYNDENENLCIEVRDTGVGISEEYQKKMFKPFTQEETGYTRKYEGNGLALALVKEYCDLNGAEIEVMSTKGEGSTFKLKFAASSY